MSSSSKNSKDIIYLIYDGDCVLCSNSAKAVKIKKSVGELYIINARTNHLLVEEVVNKGFDLNEGIIVKYQDEYYYGDKAVHLLALLSTPVDFFNKLNAWIFKFSFLATIFYPIFKLVRNLLLWIRGTPKIVHSNQIPICQLIFDNDCKKLPPVFYVRYSLRILSTDEITVSGFISFIYSKFFCVISFLFRMVGVTIPYSENPIPCTVKFSSNEQNKRIYITRVFHAGNKSYKFNSYLLPIQNKIVIEFVKYGIGWRSRFSFIDNKIKMTHEGYVIKIFNFFVPLPLSILIGKCYAEEEVLSDTEFKMLVKITHPFFGELFQYHGNLKMVK